MSKRNQNQDEEIKNEEIREENKNSSEKPKDDAPKKPKETDEDLSRLTGTALENRIFQAIDLGEVDVFQKCYPRHEPDKYWDNKIDIVVNETGGSYEKLPTGIRVYLLPIHIGYLCQSPNPELDELEETLSQEMKKTIPDKERTIFLEETLRRMIALDDRYFRDKMKCIVCLYDSLGNLVDNHYVEKWQDRICDTVCDYLKGKQKLLDRAVQYSGTDDYPEHLADELKIAAGHDEPEEFETQDVTTSKRWIATAVVGVLVVVLAVCYVVVMHGNRGGSDVVTVEQGSGGSGGSAAGTESGSSTVTAGSTQGTETQTQEAAGTVQSAQTSQEAVSADTAQTANTADTSSTQSTENTETTETTEQEGEVDMSDVPSEGSTMSITQTYTVYSEMSEDESKANGEVISGYSVIVDHVHDNGWIEITYYTGSPLTEHKGYIKYR